MNAEIEKWLEDERMKKFMSQNPTVNKETQKEEPWSNGTDSKKHALKKFQEIMLHSCNVQNIMCRVNICLLL